MLTTQRISRRAHHSRRGAAWRESAASRVKKQTGKSTETSVRVAQVDSILVTSPKHSRSRGDDQGHRAQKAGRRPAFSGNTAKVMLPGEVAPPPRKAREHPVPPNDNGDYKRKSRTAMDPA